MYDDWKLRATDDDREEEIEEGDYTEDELEEERFGNRCHYNPF